MAKKYSLIQDSLSQIYSSSERWKVKKAIRKIVEHLDASGSAEQHSIMNYIIAFMTRHQSVATTIDTATLERNCRDLGLSLAAQALGFGDGRFVATFFLPDYKASMGAEALDIKTWLGTTFMEYVGQTLDRTLAFCKVIYKIRNRITEQISRSGESQVTDEDKNFTITMFYIVAFALQMPATEGSEAHKGWFLRLIEGAAKGNRDARGYLEAIMNWGTTFSKTEQIQCMPQSLYDSNYGKSKTLPVRLRVDPVLIIPDHLISPMTAHLDRIQRMGRRYRALSATFLGRFESQREQIAKTFDRRCAEIQKQPRYGLRPMGYDSIMTRVSPLRAIGITSFSYYPEGETFPNAKIMITVDKDGNPMLSQYWLLLRDFQLVSQDELFANTLDLDPNTLRAILEYIVIDALHRIVVFGRMRDLDKNVIQRKELGAFIEPKHQVKVRPFLRRLPIGYQASDEARQLAFLELGWELPDGVTYVQSHDRWTGLPAGKPAPLLVYTDGEFQRSIDKE